MMVERRTQELQETERRAHAYLLEAASIPSTPSLAAYSLHLRFWHYPAFEEYRSWSIFDSQGRGQPSVTLVRQVTWDRPHDCQRLRDPLHGMQEGFHSEPKIEVRDRALDAIAFTARLDAATSLSLPVIGRYSGICLDGARFGFEERYGSSRLEWCCDGPAEWREFTGWATRMMSWLRETCAA